VKSLIGSFIGLVLSVSVGAESLLEGRVRLSSGQPAAGVQVRLFDLTDLRRFVGTTTDETGHFALSLQAFSTASGTALPTAFALGQNYPNPFNPSTIIPYQLTVGGHVRLEVFNLLGQRLATLVDAERSAGMHTARWDATDAAGRAAGAGVYIYRLSSGGQAVSRRMVLVDGQAGVPAGMAPGVVQSAVEGALEADGSVYGLTVSGTGLIPYVNPAFRVGVDEADIVLEERGNARMKRAAGGVLGDVNGNSQVDIVDALLVAMYSVDPSSLAAHIPNIALGDVDADGDIDFTDAYLIGLFLVDPSDPALPPGIGQDLDDTLAGATEVSLGSSTAGGISEGDVDYFRVTMSSADTLTVYTTGDTDTQGTILDRAGTVLAHSSSGAGSNFRVSVPVSAGTYYIEVTRGSSSSHGGYYTLYVVGSLDLVVAASVNDSTLAFGQPFTLRAMVRNQGSGEPEPTVLFYYSSTDATITSDDTQVSADVVSLATADGVMKSISLTAPEEAGTYYYGACVQSVSGERNTDNNCSDAVRVTASSDFVYAPSTLSHMYWTDPVEGSIHRASLDGSNVKALITGPDSPVALALDAAGSQMYWMSWRDWRGSSIHRASLNGSYVETLLGLLSRTGSMSIHRASLDGSYVETLVTGEGYPVALALDVAGGQMYWTVLDGRGGRIHRASLNGSNVEVLFTEQLYHPVALALDVVGGQMYWMSLRMDGRGGRTYRASLDGSNVEVQDTGSDSPVALALDVAGGQMYWMSLRMDGGNSIHRVSLDSSNYEVLFTGSDSPVALALDVAGGQMYWMSWRRGGRNSIHRASLDGSNVKALITERRPNGLALDVVGGQIYWTDKQEGGSIYRASLDGSNVEALITERERYLSGLALDVARGQIYWTELDWGWEEGVIYRASLDGSNVETLVTGLNRPADITLGP
jgi:sugar lactone lactonase YvrE